MIVPFDVFAYKYIAKVSTHDLWETKTEMSDGMLPSRITNGVFRYSGAALLVIRFKRYGTQVLDSWVDNEIDTVARRS